MKNNEHTVRFTLAELLQMKTKDRDEYLTDWARIDAMTEEELEASIDWEDEGEFDLSRAYAGRFPAVTWEVTVPFDAATVARFKSNGGDYRERMRYAFRDYVDAQHFKLAAEPRSRRRQAS